MSAEAKTDPFAALGDEHRRTILQMLAERQRQVGELAESLPISRPAVSRHLRLLKEAGLVVDRAEGTKRIYSLDDRGVQAMRDYMEQIWGSATTRFRIAAENVDEKHT